MDWLQGTPFPTTQPIQINKDGVIQLSIKTSKAHGPDKILGNLFKDATIASYTDFLSVIKARPTSKLLETCKYFPIQFLKRAGIKSASMHDL